MERNRKQELSYEDALPVARTVVEACKPDELVELAVALVVDDLLRHNPPIKHRRPRRPLSLVR